MIDRDTTTDGARAAARLLKALASFLEKASPDELTALLRGNNVTLSTTKRRAHNDEISKPLKSLSSMPLDVPGLAEALQSLNSRDEGFSLIGANSLTRRELEQLARLLKTPVLKTDNMERLTQKVIESSIGARLNSAAIRGNRETSE